MIPQKRIFLASARYWHVVCLTFIENMKIKSLYFVIIRSAELISRITGPACPACPPVRLSRTALKSKTELRNHN